MGRKSIEAVLSYYLIPLDKNPGLRPTGVVEVLRRIAGKVIASLLKEDVIRTKDHCNFVCDRKLKLR